MKEEKLIIVGAGEFAEIAYEYFTYDSTYEVVAFSVEEKYISQNTLFNLPVVPFEKLAEIYPPKDYQVFIAITFTQLNRARTRLYHSAKAKGYRFATYISSHAFVWRNAVIGENCFIFENNVIQYHVQISNNVVLWSGNHVGHRSLVRDNCFISSHVVISGYCEVKENCFLGVNSTLVDKIIVAKDCVIGAGAVVTKNTEAGKIYIGAPAVPAKVDSLRYHKVYEQERICE